MRRLRRMLDAGVIRRIGAVPNHYALGLPRQRHERLGRRGCPAARARAAGRRAALRHPLLPPAAPSAGLALQPVRHGARPRRATEVEAKVERDRGAARRRPAAATTCSSAPRILKKTGPAARGLRDGSIMFRLSQFMRELDRARRRSRHARAAGPGGDLEPDPALQPELHPLLLALGRCRLPGRAVDRRGLHGHGRPQGVPRAGADPLRRRAAAAPRHLRDLRRAPRPWASMSACPPTAR